MAATRSLRRRYRLSLCKARAGYSDIEVEFLKKPELNKIKSKILSVFKAIRLKKIKINIVDIFAAAIVLVLAGVVVGAALSEGGGKGRKKGWGDHI